VSERWRDGAPTEPVAMTEDDLLTVIVDAALVFGWHVHHVRRSDNARLPRGRQLAAAAERGSV
jgi:hypothetical protein